ncbi:MAG: TIGR03936 family radical SAM-associated protein [Eubacteriales bacterium]|nr:TIGR03936 family radical SAM-associated protein [Eubacteriales bacterium]
MSKLRLLFIKEAQASYISHLDLMRTFQRVFPRAGLSLRHSNGFHPHPIISIVLPLPVGQESDCELLDFETVEQSDGIGVAEALNTGMPAGIRVLACYPIERAVKELSFIRATMELDYDNGVPSGAVEKIEALFACEEVLVEKRTKHKELAEINIRPMIQSLTLTEEENMLRAEVIVMAQNPGLNPAFIGAAIAKYLPELAPSFVRVRRHMLYDAEMKEFR